MRQVCIYIVKNLQANYLHMILKSLEMLGALGKVIEMSWGLTAGSGKGRYLRKGFVLGTT